MEVGMKITIGSKHADKCSYDDVAGKKATISHAPYLKENPYRLRGNHWFCRVQIPNNYDWEVHIEDCIPVSNKESKHVLSRLED